VPVKVTVEDEAVNVLTRTYNGEPTGELLASLSTKQKLIYDCVYARNWDGFVLGTYHLVGSPASEEIGSGWPQARSRSSYGRQGFAGCARVE
jgi:hypothetical protein